MKLIIKINLVLLAVFLVAMALSYSLAQSLLLKNAQQEVNDNARIMMASALAVRSYTGSQIKPLLSTQIRYQFLPQSVPSYSATEYFNTLRKEFPDYAYKEATLNPTNPRDRAVDWEVDVVNHFRQDSTQTEMMGEHDGGAAGRSLYLAKPMSIDDPTCLDCHSAVDKAPQTMLDRYGSANGFGWNLHEVVGAQIVSVPYKVPYERANAVLWRFVGLLSASFLFLFITVNVFLYFLVVRPVRQLAKIADQVSLGELEAPEFQTGTRDEIGTLGVAFNRLRRSLDEALGMLTENPDRVQ